MARSVFQRIVVATDFSRPSNRAFRFSLQLAKQLDAEVIAIFVKNADDLAIALRKNLRVERRDVQLKSRVKKFIERNFQRLMQRMVQPPPVQFVIAEGTPWKQILSIAKKEKADLIVTGTRSRSPFSRAVLGSTAEQLVLHSTCPVITLKATK
jgi:nucleotide-binding universal stress UspA family protein